MSEEERPSAEELLEALDVKAIRALRRAGFGLPRLREMARGEDGDDRVRAVVGEFSADDAPRRAETIRPPRPVPRAADRTPLIHRVVRRWSLVVLFDLAAAVLCWLVMLAGGRAMTVAVLFGLLILHGVWVLRAMPDAPGRRTAAVLAWTGLPVLLLSVVYASPRTYLAMWGREGTAAADSRTWTRANGGAPPTCYVRLPDGQVRELVTDDRTCAHLDVANAEPIPVVFDPSEEMLPVSGTKASLGIGRDAGVAAGGLLLVVLGAGNAIARTARRGRPVP